MASVQEIIAINSRQGNSEKGGSQTYGITIDASPFQRLAEYTYLDNVQKQKDKVAKDQQIATEMGKVMALDPNATNKELYEALNSTKDEINYLIKNNKDVFDYNKNPSGNIKLKELLSKFTSNRTKATTFDVLNNAAEAEISKLSPEEQGPARKVLENKRKITLLGGADNFFKTGVQLDGSIMDFKQKDYTIPKIAVLDYTIVDIGDDTNMSRQAKVLDVNSAIAKGELEWLGIQQDRFVPEENPTNDPKIALQNENGKLKSDANTKGKFSDETLAKMNALIEEYKQSKAAWDANPVGPEPQKTSQMIAIDAVNENILAASATLGRARQKNPNLKVPTFSPIKYSDGLTGAELITLETLASQKDGFVTYDEKDKYTGSAIQRRQQDISNGNADADRAVRISENARAYAKAGGKGAVGGGTDSYDGNDFSQIQNHKYPKGTQIVGGYVLNNDKTAYTGPIQVPISKIPKTILNTIQQLDKTDGYKVTGEPGKEFVEFYVENGMFKSVSTDKGGIITRQNQIAGQGNFDKRSPKLEPENAFGGGGEEITEWQPD